MMTMKKLFKSLFVVIAATATFAGCQKEENNAPANQTKTVEFFANSIATKTQFGDSYQEEGKTKYPTIWTAGDKVKVLMNLETVQNVSKLEATSQAMAASDIFNDGASARFKAELNSDYQTTAYTYYAVAPSTAYNGKSADDGRLTVMIPSNQTPSTNGLDKAAQIIYAVSDTYSSIQDAITLNFKHFTAYGKFSLTNLTDQIGAIASVSLEFEGVDVVGTWNYYPSTDTKGEQNGSNKITLTTSSATDIWFACAPVDVSGKNLKVTVTDVQGKQLVKEITMPADRVFESGKVSSFTVNMSGIVPPVQEITKCYQKVTASQSDWTGTYLIVYEDGAKAYVFNATDAANGYLSATITDGKIASNSDTDAVQVQIESMSGGYSIKTSKGYIYGSSGSNKLNFNASTKQVNTIAYSNNSIVITSGRVLQFNSASDQMRFRYYSSGGQKTIQLYKLIDGELGGETPEQPETPAPVLSVTATEVNVAATAGNGEIAYSVENAVDGKTVSATTTATWITNFGYTTAGKVTFAVAANTGAERSAVVTLTYPGATESMEVIVKQAADQSGGDEPEQPSEPVTISKAISTVAETNGWTNETQYKTISLDNVITATVAGGGNTGKYYTNGTNWRLYQSENASITISAVEGYTIKSVKITYSVSNTGTLKNGSSNVTSGSVNTVNASYVTYTVGNTGTKTNGQVRITAIEVVYLAN